MFTVWGLGFGVSGLGSLGFEGLVCGFRSFGFGCGLGLGPLGFRLSGVRGLGFVLRVLGLSGVYCRSKCDCCQGYGHGSKACLKMNLDASAAGSGVCESFKWSTYCGRCVRLHKRFRV